MRNQNSQLMKGKRNMNINWITINVNSLEKSKEFYGGYLGLELKSSFSPNDMMSIVFYKAANGMQIELIESKMQKDIVRNNCGVSIGIASGDYEDLLTKARERNIIIAEPQIMGNMECFFVQDPNNFNIQIIRA